MIRADEPAMVVGDFIFLFLFSCAIKDLELVLDHGFRLFMGGRQRKLWGKRLFLTSRLGENPDHLFAGF